MSTLHNNLTKAIDSIIDSKLEYYEILLDEKIEEIERQIRISSTNPTKEILMQKEVFDLLGIGRRRLKNWVDRGLNEIRVDNRVYYRYSDLMHFIENSSNH